MCWRRAVLGFGCLLVVSCDGPTGPQLVGPAMLRVTVSTAGPDPDPDGYLVIVDGLQLATIGLSDQWIDSTLHVGSHSVLLGGTAANCTVTSPNPVPIYVKAHTLATATFAVQCVSTHGSLHVTATTSGVDLDPDGYVVCVDPSAGYYGTSCAYGPSITVNGAVTLSVSAGDHRVLLQGIAGNCVVSGENPRMVSTSVGNTTEVALSLTCATLPRLHITTATTGGQVDPNGYTACVDPQYDYYDDLYCYSGAPQAIGLNGTLTIGVPAGNHTVLLNDVADNCTVGGANPRPVSATATDTTQVPFSITCPPPGSVHVSTSTVGVDVDPDGYSVCIDRSPSEACHWSRPFSVNDGFSFKDVTAGSHSVVLSGAAGNCAVNGDNRRTVTVPEGGTVDVTFSVTCVLAERIAFSQNGAIAIVHADGSALTTVTSGRAPAGALPSFMPCTPTARTWCVSPMASDSWGARRGRPTATGSPSIARWTRGTTTSAPCMPTARVSSGSRPMRDATTVPPGSRMARGSRSLPPASVLTKSPSCLPTAAASRGLAAGWWDQSRPGRSTDRSSRSWDPSRTAVTTTVTRTR